MTRRWEQELSKRWSPEDRGLHVEARAHEEVEVVSGDKEVPLVMDEGQTSAQVPESPKGPVIDVEEVG